MPQWPDCLHVAISFACFASTVNRVRDSDSDQIQKEIYWSMKRRDITYMFAAGKTAIGSKVDKVY